MSLILNGTDGLSDIDGSAATPAIRGTDANTGIFFPAADTIAFSEGGVEAMRIDSSGNVGIGTSSPSGRVHAVSAPGTVQVRWSDATNGTANLDTASGLSRVWSNVALAFGTGAESFTERARIDSSGNLLVGKTSAGTSNTGFEFTPASGVARINLTSSGTGVQSKIVFFNNSGTYCGEIFTGSGTSTTYSTASDYRLKEDVQPMTGALARNALLNPVKYKWKIDGREGEGFIAHQLQAQFASAVIGEKDAVDADGNPVYQGIGTGPLDGHFAACINELQATIQEQQALIQSLTDRITALETPNV